jgi:hypothetical protein
MKQTHRWSIRGQSSGQPGIQQSVFWDAFRLPRDGFGIRLFKLINIGNDGWETWT